MPNQQKLGRCALVWRELERMAKRNPRPALRDIMRVSARKGWNDNNTRTEYYSWRRAHGIYGRTA